MCNDVDCICYDKDLHDELSSIYAALNDERVDRVISATEAIMELKAKLAAAEARAAMLNKAFNWACGMVENWSDGECAVKSMYDSESASDGLAKHDEAVRNQRIITDEELIDLVDDWLESPVSALDFAKSIRAKCEGNQEMSIDRLDQTAMLERVYECARQFLRFNGVDKERTRKAIDSLDDAVEAVKTARENDENANESVMLLESQNENGGAKTAEKSFRPNKAILSTDENISS